MKTFFLNILLCAAAGLGLAACSEEKLSDESVIVETKVEETAFDKWLTANFVNTYNINFEYRFADNQADMGYYTVPARLEESVKMAHLLKHVCLETYDEVAGINFTRANFPKHIFLIGEWQYKNNGTFILGTAEGGKEIYLTGVNDLSTHLSSAADLNYYYLKTIHHEFTHILNQNKPYQNDFRKISDTGYVNDEWNVAPNDTGYLHRGFISAYSQDDDREDYAELLSIYVTSTPEQWETWMVEAAKGTVNGVTGRQLIEQKLEMVRNYMKDSWGVVLDELRAAILRRQQDVMTGKVSLTDLKVE